MIEKQFVQYDVISLFFRWMYAYRAIREGQIIPKREQFRWSHIKLVTQLRKDYVNILKKKLKSVKLTTLELEMEKVKP